MKEFSWNQRSSHSEVAAVVKAGEEGRDSRTSALQSDDFAGTQMQDFQSHGGFP